MDMVYRTNWIARTRRRAAWLVFWYFLIIIPSLVSALGSDPSRRDVIARVTLALAPVLLARLCWRFLEDAETRHDEPTPEMEFVFRLMTTILIALGGIVLGVLELG
jgi:hypothetical protein